MADFVGSGDLHRGPWYQAHGPVVTDLNAFGHPARYSADEGLVAAVKTAMLLDKPLLLTGNPGTGKSELADRIAWELQLGAVERFESQSLSEANDLFYRFDLVGRMAARELSDSRLPKGDDTRRAIVEEPLHAANFVEFGPLGRALLRAQVSPTFKRERDARIYQALRRSALASERVGEASQAPVRRSVVLIDEIDKTSRDFPNDLLNNIDRTEFKIKELDELPIAAPDRALGLHPIIIITSNQERDLPGPFLRRCTFFHIADPSPNRLRDIVRDRVFPELPAGAELPLFYKELLGFFVEFRQGSAQSLSYTPGTSELLDVTRALRRRKADPQRSLKSQLSNVREVMSAIAKHRDDWDGLNTALNNL